MSNTTQPKLVAQAPRNAASLRPRLTVIGVGGAGCNAINNMIEAGLENVDFIAANTDAQSLEMSRAERRVQLGASLTEGLGAGSKPEIGEAAAEEAADEIRSHIGDAHMVFIAAGMGGGTGTGAATVIARIARELGVLAVGVVTTPFQFEGSRRMRVAEAGLAELKKYVDTLIVIPNQNLFRIAHDKTTFAEAFVLADRVLYSGVSCIVDLIMKEGLINLDFADVRTVMSGMGTAVMGTGEAAGERRAILAAEEAISNPLLDDISLKGAKGLLLSISGGNEMTLYEVDEAASRVRQEVDSEANIIVGATYDDSLAEKVRVSIVASGMNQPADAAKRIGEAPRAAKAAAPSDVKSKPIAATGAAMQERLTAALGRQPEPGAEAGSDASGEAPARRRGALWQGPGNVVVEDGLSDLAEPDPAPEARKAAGPRDPEPLVLPPASGARNPRRMPDVEDFPIVAQREYRAKTPRSADARALLDPEPAPAARRPGLLERLTGRTRP